jgi:hypothetical protein
MSDILGYAAASAVLATFLMRSMVPLRLVAILSNVLFISYGYLAHIHPVLLLHAALLPINIARLATHRGAEVSSSPGHDSHLAPATAGIRHISRFILGLGAGPRGRRAFIRIARRCMTHDTFRRSASSDGISIRSRNPKKAALTI